MDASWRNQRGCRVKGIIVTSPALKSALQEQKLKVLLTKLLANALPTLAIKSGLDLKLLCRDPKVADDYANDALNHSLVTTSWGKSVLHAIDLAYQNAPHFPLPLLIMHGTEDHVAYPQSSLRFAELAPKDKVTLKMWEGFKHELHTDPEKAEVFKVMISWLGSHLAD